MIRRKTLFLKEVITSDEHGVTCAPITRVAALAVVKNPLAGASGEDLSQLFELAATLGPVLSAKLVAMLPKAAVSYGKAALIGTAGCMEQGAAVLHPKLGAPVRAAIGGGKALMPANHKMVACGGVIDMPLGHKDNPWSFDHIDTMTVGVPDAPLADEIVLCIGLSDGTRVLPRVGSGPAR